MSGRLLLYLLHPVEVVQGALAYHVLVFVRMAAVRVAAGVAGYFAFIEYACRLVAGYYERLFQLLCWPQTTICQTHRFNPLPPL